MDGKGYPDGIKGAAIPVQARLLMHADTFDAPRSWRRASMLASGTRPGRNYGTGPAAGRARNCEV